MALTSPFDIFTIFMVDLAGNAEVFTFLAIILVSFILSRFNFSARISLTLFALFGVIMSTYLGGIYVVAMLLIGIVTFYTFSKLVR